MRPGAPALGSIHGKWPFRGLLMGKEPSRTARMRSQAAASRPDDAGRIYILSKVREMKMRTSAIATFAPLSILIAGLLGVTAHTGKTPAWLHLVTGIFALLLHLVAFGKEVLAMSETNQLMDEAATLVPPAASTTTDAA